MRRIGTKQLLVLAITGTGGVGACSSLTGPDEVCNTSGDIKICTDRAEYATGATVSFTITNLGQATVFQDMCSGGTVGRRKTNEEWSPVSGTTRLCREDQTIEDVIANMRPLERGQTLNDQIKTSTFAFQGYWKLQVYVVDQDGHRIREDPFDSAVFEIFPSAG
jgi:hypothetical protein